MTEKQAKAKEVASGGERVAWRASDRPGGWRTYSRASSVRRGAKYRSGPRGVETRAKYFATQEWRKANAKAVAKYSNTAKGRANKRVQRSRRRARKLGAAHLGNYTQADAEKKLLMQACSCFYCLGDIHGGYHVEHMVPLARGGSNAADNICLSCGPCNLAKGTKTHDEYLEEMSLKGDLLWEMRAEFD